MNDNRDLLMTYTVFHIGVYLSLAAAIIAGQNLAANILGPAVLKFSLVMFFLAGVCGAVVASHLHEHKSWADYQDADIGIYGLLKTKYTKWERAEHAFFWAGATALVVKALLM